MTLGKISQISTSEAVLKRDHCALTWPLRTGGQRLSTRLRAFPWKQGASSIQQRPLWTSHVFQVPAMSRNLLYELHFI